LCGDGVVVRGVAAVGGAAEESGVVILQLELEVVFKNPVEREAVGGGLARPWNSFMFCRPVERSKLPPTGSPLTKLAWADCQRSMPIGLFILPMRNFVENALAEFPTATDARRGKLGGVGGGCYLELAAPGVFFRRNTGPEQEGDLCG